MVKKPNQLAAKARTYDERLKMKRDTRQKSSLFLRKRTAFLLGISLILGRSSYVTALVEGRNFCRISFYAEWHTYIKKYVRMAV